MSLLKKILIFLIISLILLLLFNVIYISKISFIIKEYSKSNVNLLKFLLIIILINIISFLIMLVLFKKSFIKRINNLKNSLDKIEINNLNQFNINDKYNDEVSNLTLSIKNLIKKIEIYKAELNENINIRLKSLNCYDQLTGLYNRAFLEQEIKKFDNEKYLPISIIVLDVNGLRIVNNQLNSKAGDEILKKIASCLKSSCRQDELISRWGGDEFLIVLPNTNEKLANKIAQRIKDNCSNFSINDLTLNISIGISIKNNKDESLYDIIIKAEERMNRHKLFEINSINSSVVLSLERALWEKSSETEKHAERLKKLAVMLGEKINLSSNLIDDLILLASLHDIGKLGISEDVLSKKTKLSQSDWEIIKKHPEIGYQIAKSSPQLSHIADFILAHHERWDGSGYPRGLKGNEIPLISRIISIVDAFDVMIEGRVYKSPRTVTEAIEELKRCSGTQFDPELVKIFIEIIEPSIYNISN